MCELGWLRWFYSEQGGECTQETLAAFAGRMDVNRNESRIFSEFNKL